ncbi:hypothetical protein BJX65DRAFT_312035 [Aspergillus insuetus]
MADKPAIDLIEEPSPYQSFALAEKPTFKARLIAHFKRWWWVYLLVLIAVTLLVTLPFIYVGYPRIAQDGINSATLTILSMEITNPSTSGFHFHQVQELGSDSIFHPHLYGFNATVRLPGFEDPMMHINVPGLKAKDGATFEVDQDVTLQNPDVFAEFSKAMMLQEEVTLNIYGRPRLQQPGLQTITVNYNHTISIKGLNRLAGFEIVELQLDPNRDDGMNAVGSVLIPNPSVVTLAMGNVTFDLSSGGTELGPAIIRDLVVRPGNTTAPIVANINELALLGLLPHSPPFTIEIQARGNSSMYNGEQLTYYQTALEANPIEFTFDVSSALPS